MRFEKDLYHKRDASLKQKISLAWRENYLYKEQRRLLD
jgi:hypothetical protein